MNNEKKSNILNNLPEETNEETKALIKNAFRLFSDQIKQITEDVTEFNEKRKVVKERIQRGARRTSGHIV